ncbi:uncharacterized protein LOC131856880 [Cryptomeria japonica]|uniref:uncharacterized protein LOC131856880 n=1 Tax=Cryptomeria japonica TaxID=3369 RepID=UPI0027DA6CC3|nr:uncharacterized protein LOC131856880 [Cryptomeria japonica]
MSFPLFNVCGPTKIADKEKVWKDISDKIGSLNNDKVIVAGNFKALLELDDKKGGLRMNSKVMEDFREFVASNSLFDVKPKNGLFTWTNRRDKFSRIFERMGRFLVKPHWVDSELNVDSCILPWSLSDHFPIQLLFIRIEKELEDLNNLVISAEMTNEDFVRENLLKEELSKTLQREEAYWRDKARENWIKAGDFNIKFFHASIKSKRACNWIFHIQDDLGEWQEEADIIKDLAVSHF